MAAKKMLHANVFPIVLPDKLGPLWVSSGTTEEVRELRSEFPGLWLWSESGNIYASGLTTDELETRFSDFDEIQLGPEDDPRVASALAHSGFVTFCSANDSLFVQSFGIGTTILRTDQQFYHHPDGLSVYEGTTVQTLFWKAPDGRLCFGFVMEWVTQQEFDFTAANLPNRNAAIGADAIGWAPNRSGRLADWHRRRIGTLDH